MCHTIATNSRSAPLSGFDKQDRSSPITNYLDVSYSYQQHSSIALLNCRVVNLLADHLVDCPGSVLEQLSKDTQQLAGAEFARVSLVQASSRGASSREACILCRPGSPSGWPHGPINTVTVLASCMCTEHPRTPGLDFLPRYFRLPRSSHRVIKVWQLWLARLRQRVITRSIKSTYREAEDPREARERW
ncbi:hypothetical protein CONLIGDRAFT_450347 [Coniochaeta ligniaria NRRL 30616]|uniref:Uncharacterized protein n=1 Tax=Coniochaeta ligniaria NRRL 30616 TaxID=1408157 RepID=A0A1J7JJF1_9PEZI|nr:hypothetical protein CONLIGDRAFT_450347 [Coniochaeta ligniaria NRRL 30616]